LLLYCFTAATKTVQMRRVCVGEAALCIID
jgi:hypothetical protein